MDEFIISWPVWLVATGDSVERDERGRPVELKRRPAFRIAKKDDLVAVHVFTDEDLADRYVRASGDPSLVTVSPDTRELLVRWLRRLAENGVNHVLFDAAPVGRFLPIERVVEGVERGEV